MTRIKVRQKLPYRVKCDGAHTLESLVAVMFIHKYIIYKARVRWVYTQHAGGGGRV